jgi:hypothetical protein
VNEDEDEGTEEEAPSVQDDVTNLPTTAESGVKREAKGDHAEETKKRRFAHMFSLKRRKSAEHPQPHEPKESRTEQQRPHDHAREKERHQRELEMRRKEQERRDAELAQGGSSQRTVLMIERRFKALTQVAAHPDAERLAYRTSSHLRAFYNLVYDGIENPPKMNPLAVLRWRMRTDEQAEAKARWEEEHQGKSKNGTSKPWNMAIHASPGSYGSSTRLERGSNDLARASSSGSGRPWGLNGARRVLGKNESQMTGRGWRYTVEDVSAYSECGGAVNYWIPPREPAPTNESEQSINATSTHAPEEDNEGSSVMGSSKKGDSGYNARVTSASAVSLASAPLSRQSSNALSRSGSIETGRVKFGSNRKVSTAIAYC